MATNVGDFGNFGATDDPPLPLRATTYLENGTKVAVCALASTAELPFASVKVCGAWEVLQCGGKV